MLGRPLASEETDKLVAFVRLIQRWNKIHRLVGSSGTRWIVENVVLDSLLFAGVLPAGCRRLVDVGSGCGAPGIPLKVVLPDVEVILVESRERRVSFLRTVIRVLDLVGAVCIGRRAEDVDEASLGGAVDAAVSKAVADVAGMAQVARRFVRPGGSVIVSGPPVRGPVPSDGWLVVEGVRPGSRRRFGVVRIDGE